MEELESRPEVVDGVLSYPIWHKTGGGWMINRDCLDFDHPEQTYNYLVRYGIAPEEFGVEHPRTEEFTSLSRSALIDEIIRLRKEIEWQERY